MPRKQRFKPSRKPKPALVQEDIVQIRQGSSEPSDETGKSSISMDHHGNAERQESTGTPKRETGAEG